MSAPATTGTSRPEQVLLVSPGELLRLVRRSPAWVLFCLAAALVSVGWFSVYPPRGWVAQDVIAIGNVYGSPLIDFSRVWNGLFQDDKAMLKVLHEAQIATEGDLQKDLDRLNREIRPNLTFTHAKEDIAVITFQQGDRGKVRPFLNAFTATLLASIRAVEREELGFRLERAAALMGRYQGHQGTICQLFGLVPPGTPAGPFLSDAAQASPGVADSSGAAGGPWSPPSPAGVPATNATPLSATRPSGLGVPQLFGMLAHSELDYQRFLAEAQFRALTATDGAFLQVYPRISRLLTNNQAKARPVQPNLGLFLLLVAGGWVSICLGVLIVQALQVGRETGRQPPGHAGTSDEPESPAA